MEQENLGLDIQCRECKDFFHEDDISGNCYCGDCYDELFYFCADCSEEVHKDDVETSPDGDALCRDCFEHEYFSCEGCSEVTSYNYGLSNSWGNYYCEDCFYETYTRCEGCEDTIYREDSYYNESDGCEYCAACYDESHGLIHDWDYRPYDWNRHSMGFEDADKGIFMGVELEVESCNGDRQRGAELMHEFDPDEGVFFLKKDGSLSHGFEIVSHPCTLDYHREKFGWKQMQKILRDEGFKSHDVSTCGLHVHVGKENLTHTEQIRLGMFIHIQQDRMERIARRRHCEYAKYKNREEQKPYRRINKNDYDRYEVINWQNSETFEFRLFKGTLKTSTFLATLEFVDSVVRFVKTVSSPVIADRSRSWREYCEFVRAQDYKYLKDYMGSRRVQ